MYRVMQCLRACCPCCAQQAPVIPSFTEKVSVNRSFSEMAPIFTVACSSLSQNRDQTPNSAERTLLMSKNPPVTVVQIHVGSTECQQASLVSEATAAVVDGYYQRSHCSMPEHSLSDRSGLRTPPVENNNSCSSPRALLAAAEVSRDPSLQNPEPSVRGSKSSSNILETNSGPDEIEA